MTDPEDDSTRSGALKRLIDRAKNHIVVTVVVTLVGIGVFVFKAEDVYIRAKNGLISIFDPHAADYAALATLDLDTRLPFFEAKFGPAKSEYNLCEEKIVCPEQQDNQIIMYVHQTPDFEVRAIFDGERLSMYAVTLVSDQMSPQMKWHGWPLGDLGKVTYSQVLAVVDPPVGPTDAEIFLGPKTTAYAEVVAQVAPAGYRGLLLANAPAGYSGPRSSFDLDSGRLLQESQEREQPPDAGAVKNFRAGSTPNTFGEFRDDGRTVGNLLRDAAQLIPVLALHS